MCDVSVHYAFKWKLHGLYSLMCVLRPRDRYILKASCSAFVVDAVAWYGSDPFISSFLENDRLRVSRGKIEHVS